MLLVVSMTQGKNSKVVDNINILQAQNFLSPIHCINLSPGVYRQRFEIEPPEPCCSVNIFGASSVLH